MSTVYVLNKDGKPLMPTTRCGHVRYLLKEKKARVVKTKPFTIQLLYETNDVVQPLYLGIDPGRTNIGVAVVKTDGTAVFTAHLETQHKDSLYFVIWFHQRNYLTQDNIRIFGTNINLNYIVGIMQPHKVC